MDLKGSVAAVTGGISVESLLMFTLILLLRERPFFRHFRKINMRLPLAPQWRHRRFREQRRPLGRRFPPGGIRLINNCPVHETKQRERQSQQDHVGTTVA